MSKISLLPKLAAPTGREPVIVADPADGNKTKTVDVGALASAAAAPSVARAEAFAVASDLSAKTSAANAAAGTAQALPVVQKSAALDRNWFNKLAITPGSLVNKNTGVVSAAAGYFATEYFYVPPEGFMFSGVIGFNNSAPYSVAFFDANNAVVAGPALSAPYTIPAWTNIARPAGAVKARFSAPNAYLESGHIVYGSTLPAAFRAFDVVDAYQGPIDTTKRVSAIMGSINLFDPDTVDAKGIPIVDGNLVQGFWNSSGVLSAGGAYASNATPIKITPGSTYTFAKLFQANAAIGIVWLAADGVTKVGNVANLAGYTLTAPPGAEYMLASWADTWPAHAQSNAQVIVEGSAIPARYSSRGRVSAQGATIAAQKRAEILASPVVDYYDPTQRIEDMAMTAAGGMAASAGNDLTNIIPGYPGCQRVFNVNSYNGSGSGGVGFYDRDNKFLFLGYMVGGLVTTNSGSAIATLTAGTGRLYKGMPITCAAFPAGTYVTDFSDPKGGLGTVTMSAPATADNASAIALSGGGVLRDVPITYPDPACGARFIIVSAGGYALQITNRVPGVGEGAVGLRNIRARMPLYGQPVITGGDSLIEGGNDAGGGSPPQYGVIQWIMRKECGFRLVEARGSGGAQTRQLLDDRGNGLGVATAATFAGVRYYTDDSGTNSWGVYTGATNVAVRATASVVLGTVTDTWVPTDFQGTVTAGQTTLTGIVATRGALADKMPVLAANGTQVDVGTTLVDLGSGTWGLSKPALASGGSIALRGGTFAGDLYDIFIRKIMTWEPNIVVLLGTPPRRFDGTGNPAATTGANLADLKAGDPMNNQGVRLSQFAQMKLDWAKYYNIACDDMFNSLGVNEANFAAYYNVDRVHWNRLGNTRIWAPRWARFINAQPLPLDY